MAENEAVPTEVHVYKPDEQGNTVVIEGEKNWTNKDDPNVTESHHQKEQIIIENPNDPVANVTHRLEDIHVTVNNETVAPVESKLDQASEKAAETVQAVEEKAAEVKQDAAVAAQDAQEKVKEVAQDVKGTIIQDIWLIIDNLFWIEKVTEVAADTKDAVVAGEKVVEEKLATAKETVVGKFWTNNFIKLD